MAGCKSEIFALDKGTTTASFITKDGIVVAVDSRATSGSYIASQTVNKVIEVNKYLLGTMAGGAADCFYWERAMGNYAMRHELKYGSRIPVVGAANYLSSTLDRYKGRGISIGSMVCGWGSDGPAIYYVDDSGNCVNGQIFSVGSGSLFAYGVLNGGYSYDLEKEEAIELGRRAIFHAGHSDAYSGGTVNVYFIDADGWKKISSEDVTDLYEKYVQ